MDKPFLYKYQPVGLNQFELDDEMLIILKTLIDMNNMNIMFIGDSGCGKTSLINGLLNEYYGNSSYKKNVLYINSLKEQGITYYRNDVKTFCQTSSLIPGKKKCLILDDIDIINEQSQQVFRNYIDNYSHNVHFIGSCINSQKVIDSLQSRITILKIKALSTEKTLKIINNICGKERINITEDAKRYIVSISNNSIRVILNYLEKFKLLNREITGELAKDVCTNISFQEFDEYTKLCKYEKDLPKAINSIYVLSERGYSVMDILDNFFIYLKTSTLFTEEEKYKIIPYICKYITIFNNIHEDEIELALFTNNIITMLDSN
jgi:DNA polymerase III delta prime subunit